MNGDGRSRSVAVITAAGSGLRMGTDTAKQFLELGGRPMLAATLEKFQVCPEIHGIILVVPEDAIRYCEEEIVQPFSLTKVIKVIAGGARRQDSVRRGVEKAAGEAGLILIHDGVRPFVEPSLITRAVHAAETHGAVIVALPARETVKEVDEDGVVLKTHDRRRMWFVQTPQVFRSGDILSAHRRALEEGWDDITDDAMLMERLGIPVKVIEGDERNIKITTPHDLELARFLLKYEGP